MHLQGKQVLEEWQMRIMSLRLPFYKLKMTFSSVPIMTFSQFLLFNYTFKCKILKRKTKLLNNIKPCLSQRHISFFTSLPSSIFHILWPRINDIKILSLVDGWTTVSRLTFFSSFAGFKLNLNPWLGCLLLLYHWLSLNLFPTAVIMFFFGIRRFIISYRCGLICSKVAMPCCSFYISSEVNFCRILDSVFINHLLPLPCRQPYQGTEFLPGCCLPRIGISSFTTKSHWEDGGNRAASLFMLKWFRAWFK